LEVILSSWLRSRSVSSLDEVAKLLAPKGMAGTNGKPKFGQPPGRSQTVLSPSKVYSVSRRE
jgi:hypothetical protein